MRSSTAVRYRPDMLKAELVEARAAPVEWAAFIRQQRLHAGWSAGALAAAATAGRPVWLGMVHDRGDVVAAFCGQRLGPLFECKLPQAASLSGFAFSAELGASDRRAAVAAFERALARRLGWPCLAVAYRQVGPAELGVLNGGPRLRLGTQPTALLANRWSSMDEYFASLPHGRRKLLRRRYRSLSADPELEISITTIADSGISGAEASRLAAMTLRRHQRRPVAPPAGYFDALAGHDGALFLSYRERGRLLAFLLAFDDGAVLRCSMWGSLDPHGEGRPHLYFDYYLRLVQHMIELHRGMVGFGKGLHQIKQRYGCALVPQHVILAPC
jgi:Acetyltransferase (GNAT) domain